MAFTFLSTLLFCLGLAQAVTMSGYSPSSDVPAGFQTFLLGVYTQVEDPVSSTTFTDYFPSNGSFTVLTDDAVGASDILALKQSLNPSIGSKHWNHFPNTTTLDSDTLSHSIYHVNGRIQITFDAGNCSQAFYQTRFTVSKSNGLPGYTADSGSLVAFDTYILSPSGSPTNIPCDA